MISIFRTDKIYPSPSTNSPFHGCQRAGTKEAPFCRATFTKPSALLEMGMGDTMPYTLW